MNVNSVFIASIPRNENDFVDASPSSANSSCVDVILGSWIGSFVGVIPGNDPAFGKS